MEEEDIILEETDNLYPEEEPDEIKQNTKVYKVFTLSNLNKIILKCILNECLDQLYILRSINTQDNANFINTPIKYRSIADRYMGAESHMDYRINSTINNYEKLARDIHRIIQILKECRDDITVNSTFTSLKHAVDVTKQMREEEKQLIEEKGRNDQYIIELRKRCEDELVSNTRVIEGTNARIQKLRFEVEDLHVYKRYEFNYFENWETTRREQNTMSCEQKEQYYQKIIDDTKHNIRAENRCHQALDNYIEESKNDYLDEIQYWMKHYDEETERRETEMLNLKASMEKLVEDHTALKQKYQEHKREIEEWLEYKKKKKEKEELEALRIWGATKLQAWWRGVMYRRKLGPYSKKKGKGKDKGKKGKTGNKGKKGKK